MRRYELAAIGAALLPIGTQTGQTLALFDNGTYASAARYNGVVPLPDVGTFEESDGTLTLIGGISASGVITDELVILNAGGLTFTLARATA